MWPKFFDLTLQKVLFSTVGYGNCRAVGTVENELHVSTVPTALGKLGKIPPSFPHFPQPLLLDIVMKKKEEPLPERSNQNRVDKTLVKA